MTWTFSFVSSGHNIILSKAKTSFAIIRFQNSCRSKRCKTARVAFFEHNGDNDIGVVVGCGGDEECVITIPSRLRGTRFASNRYGNFGITDHPTADRRGGCNDRSHSLKNSVEVILRKVYAAKNRTVVLFVNKAWCIATKTVDAMEQMRAISRATVAQGCYV